MRREYLKKTEEWYVTDGLIAMWDGINNTGDGHEASPTIWKDLIGSADLQIGAGTPQFSDKCCMFRKNEAWYNNASTVLRNYGVDNRDGGTSNAVRSGTVEIVVRNNSNQINPFVMFRNNGISLNSKGIWWRPDSGAYIMSVGQSSGSSQGANDNCGSIVTDYSNVIRSISMDYASKSRYMDNVYYRDGGKYGSFSTYNYLTVGATRSVNSGNPYTYFSDADIYCIRLYDRSLTDQERTANYMCDKFRFNF